MGLTQVIVLAVLQGITEFLPISSSGHLILVPGIFGWSDQGLVFDVAVHFGSLIAVCIYFRRDIYDLFNGAIKIIRGDYRTSDSRLLLSLIIATIPAGLVGITFASWIGENMRIMSVVVFTLAVYGFLMGIVDRYSSSEREFENITIKDAFLIGIAQALALIPGTSRSGITITAGRMLGIKRQDAAKFSFLLSVPIIVMATLLEIFVLFLENVWINWIQLLLGVGISAVVAYLTIGFFMRVVGSVGLLPFAIYRLVLAAIIIVVFY